MDHLRKDVPKVVCNQIFLTDLDTAWERFEEKQRYLHFSLEGLKPKTRKRVQVWGMRLGAVSMEKSWWPSFQISLTRLGFDVRMFGEEEC